MSGIEILDGNGAVLEGTNTTDPDNTFNLSDVNVKNGSITRIEMQGGDDAVTGAGRDHLIYDLGSGNDVFQGTRNAKDTVIGGMATTSSTPETEQTSSSWLAAMLTLSKPAPATTGSRHRAPRRR